MLRNAIVLLFFAVACLALAAGDIDLSRTREVQGLTISTNGANVDLAWDPVPDAIAYKVYSCGTPDGVFTEDLNGVFDGASWTTSEAASCRFYYVAALSPDPPALRISSRGC